MAEEDNTQEEQQDEKMAKVPADKLSQLLDKVESMEEQVDELKEENEKLNEVVDRGRREQYERKQESDEMIKKVRIPFFNHKDGRFMVTGWDMVTDRVGFTQDGKMFSDQEIQLQFNPENDETFTETIDYKLFHKNRQFEEAEVLEEVEKQTKDGDTTTMFKVKLVDSGREVTIDSNYIN